MNDSTKLRGKSLRKVMRQLPYPVTIVTASAGEQIRGVTIGSFTSLSMEPPLVSFNIEHKAQMFPLLAEANHFVVHIPGTSQAELCNRFAVPDLSGTEQFARINYSLNDQDVPVLKGVVAVIHCQKYDLIEAGDHSVVVGEVLKIERHKTEEPGILYFNQAYHEVGNRLFGKPSRVPD